MEPVEYENTNMLDLQEEKSRPKRITESDSVRFAVPKAGKYNFKNVPLNDARVWALFARGDTLGCFQLEKQLGQDWAKKAKPRSIEELGVLVSILRPGPLESGMSEQYVKRKHGEEEVTYIHPALEHILSDTYGCLIYQEQAMKIAVDLAGFNPVQADNLRKAIGKKKPEEMAKVKKMFMEEAAKKGIINTKEAEEIFGWIEKSVRYSFNKSHAISYALICYLSAYQKVHFPTEFYTSWLTYSDWKPDPKEEIYNLVQNARLNNVTVNPPDVRRKNIDFEIVGDKQIIFGLSHIRGVGSKAIDNIKDLSDKDLSTFLGFLKSAKKIRRNVAESLIKSGACDCYGKSRTLMLRHLHVLLGRGEKDSFEIPPEVKPLTPKEYEYVMSKIDEKGIQNALYSLIEDGKCVKKRIPTIEAKISYLVNLQADTNRQKSIWEKLYLGLNLTCSAADDVQYTERNVKTCREVYKAENRSKVTMHCVIDAIRMRKTGEKSRNPGLDYCYLSISDNTGALINVVCWPEVYEKIKGDLIEDTVASIVAKKECWNGRDQIVVQDIQIIG
jgi:DNA polymerase III alpha subunit